MRKKSFSRILLGVMALLMVASLSSCSNDDDNIVVCPSVGSIPNALVTVKSAGETCYLQLDDKTTLLPENITKLPYDGKEVRALVNYAELNKKAEGYDKVVFVNWMDSILTKQTQPCLPTEQENDQKYGHDAVDIVRDWVTVAEDGYLTLRFRTYWGGKTHTINLLTGVNPDNPYEVELRHNACGDMPARLGDALVAFNLKNSLPDTHGKTVKLKLRWKSSAGDKTVEFDYCTGKATESSKLLQDFTETINAVE